MPRLSRYMVRASLVHLATGFLIGGLMLAHKAVPLYPAIPFLLGWHVHALLFGWTVQLAFGVAYWIFPRLSSWGFAHPRGYPELAWAALLFINGGVLLAGPGGLIGGTPAMALGTFLEVLGVVAFGLHLLPRLRPPLPGR